MKYKKAGNEWYYQINEDGSKGQSFSEKNSPGRFKEMNQPGNEIEEQFTAQELIENEAQELIDIQSGINSEARAYLEKTEKWCSRHRDQIDNGDQTSLTNIQFKKLLSKRQTARNKITDLEPIDLD